MTAADRDREAFERLLTAAKMLYANAEGCAVNHHGADFALHGLPGWLADAQADILAAETVLTHARAQAGEPVAAGAWTREDLAAGLAELDGIDLVPPLKSVVDLEYLNRADDLLTFLSVASAANDPLGAIHPAPAQEPVEVPAGMTADEAWQDLCEKDDRTSIDYPGFALIRQDELAGYMAAAPVSPAAESGERFMSDKTRQFVEPVRKMLAEGINVQALGDATNQVIDGAFRALVGHIDDLEMDLAALRTAVALASTPAPQPGGAVKVKARPLDLATMLKHAWIAGKTGTAWEDYDPTELVVYQRLAETLDIPLPTPAGEG